MPSTDDTVSWVEYVGLRLIKDVEIEIGGQRIDKHYSDFMYIWNELSLPKGKRDGYDVMVGKSLAADDGSNPETTLYVPLEFWFCRNVGLALINRAEKHHAFSKSAKEKTKSLSGCTNKIPLVLVGAICKDRTCNRIKLREPPKAIGTKYNMKVLFGREYNSDKGKNPIDTG